MDGNAKHDLEHTAEKTINTTAKTSKIFTILFGKMLLRANRYYQKHFSASMKALRNDGPTKELFVSPPLTKAEVKQIIASGKENNVLMGVKKMQPDGEYGTNQSLYKQEKLAKNEIKYQKWNERRKTVRNNPVLYKYCKNRADKYRKLSILDEQNSNDEKYVIIFNKSKMGFLNEQLENISKDRVKRMSSDGLQDINEDGMIDERDCQIEKSRGMNLREDELDKIGEDFGSCMVRSYQKNYCTQRITKEEYCEIREQLFDLRSHGACVINNNEMLIAICSEDLDKYKSYAPSDRPIKEYGAFGARLIETESNYNDIIELELADDKEYKIFKEKYYGKDFLTQIHPNGKYTVLVREVDTKELADNSKKKSTTADLVKEADEFAEKSQDAIEMNNMLEREEELAR